MNVPKLFTFVFVATIAFCAVGSVYAISEGGRGGTWPKSWPKELEPLREKAWTWEHIVGGISYDIPFPNREVFESAWPHILKLKSKGAPITLLRGPHVRAWTLTARSPKHKPKLKTAGVIIRLPRENVSKGPLSNTRIHLVVDGDIVDLNRIPLPADTPIIDKRFKDGNEK